MSFQAPSLTTTIGRTTYESEINSNFEAIQTAFNSLQNELASGGGGGGSSGNLQFSDLALGESGVLGVEGWLLSFSTDTDGDPSITVSHSATRDGYSYCVISGLLHRSNVSITQDLSDLVPSADGTYRIVVGVNSIGVPSIEYVVEHAEDESDQSSDLALWSFDLIKAGSTWSWANLRREARLLMDQSAWTALWTRPDTIVLNYSGPIETTGDSGVGFVMPYDGIIEGGYFRLRTAAQGTVTIRLRLDNTDEDNVLSGDATWSTGESGVKTVAGKTERQQVSEGEYVVVDVISADSGTDAARDLSVTVSIRKVEHDLL